MTHPATLGYLAAYATFLLLAVLGLGWTRRRP
jgi:hypothetical protein